MEEEYVYSVCSSSVPLSLSAITPGERTTSDQPIQMFEHMRNNRQDLLCHFCQKKIARNRRCIYLGINEVGDWIFSHIKCFEQR